MKKIVIPLILLALTVGASAQNYYPQWSGAAASNGVLKIPLWFPTEGSYTCRDSVLSDDTTATYYLPPFRDAYIYATLTCGQKNVDSVDAIVQCEGKDNTIGITNAYAIRSLAWANFDSMSVTTPDTMAGSYKKINMPPNIRQFRAILQEITGMEQTAANVWKLWLILTKPD